MHSSRRSFLKKLPKNFTKIKPTVNPRNLNINITSLVGCIVFNVPIKCILTHLYGDRAIDEDLQNLGLRLAFMTFELGGIFYCATYAMTPGFGFHGFLSEGPL